MEKVFEDYFSELQTDMVAICLEYVNDKADKVFIYCSYESDMYSSGFFYKINGKMIERHKVKEVIPECDVSLQMQEQVLDILLEDLKKINRVCDEFGQTMPCEIKMIYDIKNNSLKAEYKYEPVFSGDSDKTADDIEQEWFDELEKQKK